MQSHAHLAVTLRCVRRRTGNSMSTDIDAALSIIELWKCMLSPKSTMYVYVNLNLRHVQVMHITYLWAGMYAVRRRFPCDRERRRNGDLGTWITLRKHLSLGLQLKCSIFKCLVCVFQNGRVSIIRYLVSNFLYVLNISWSLSLICVLVLRCYWFSCLSGEGWNIKSTFIFNDNTISYLHIYKCGEKIKIAVKRVMRKNINFECDVDP